MSTKEKVSQTPTLLEFILKTSETIIRSEKGWGFLRLVMELERAKRSLDIAYGHKYQDSEIEKRKSILIGTQTAMSLFSASNPSSPSSEKFLQDLLQELSGMGLLDNNNPYDNYIIVDEIALIVAEPYQG
ncbi:MAG: hypothetical protein H6773_01590 [Pseudomonadales bacterium]|nr:hypothetical protein [Pseudomonadales bacterium]